MGTRLPYSISAKALCYTTNMKVILSQHVRVFLISLLLLIFVLVGFLGAGYSVMAVDVKGEMSLCPLMGVNTFCKMNPFEHITTWQRMFVAVPQKDILVPLLFVLFSILGMFAFRNVSRSNTAVSTFCLVVLRRAGMSPVNRALQEAFSSGILNPKIF